MVLRHKRKDADKKSGRKSRGAPSFDTARGGDYRNFSLERGRSAAAISG
jgi:hypothetical protein